MDLTDAELQEFMAIWQQEFGETISTGEARQRANQLLELYFLLAHPVPKADKEEETKIKAV